MLGLKLSDCMTDTVLFVKGQTFLVKFTATPKRGRILSPFYIPSVVICKRSFYPASDSRYTWYWLIFFYSAYELMWCSFLQISDPLGWAPLYVSSNWLSRELHWIIIKQQSIDLCPSRALNGTVMCPCLKPGGKPQRGVVQPHCFKYQCLVCKRDGLSANKYQTQMQSCELLKHKCNAILCLFIFYDSS